MVKKWVKKVRKPFEVRKFFGGTNITPSLQEQFADSSEEPTCRPILNSNKTLSLENFYIVLKRLPFFVFFDEIF